MKKINKGLILTIIVVIALTMYLINLEKQRNEETKIQQTVQMKISLVSFLMRNDCNECVNKQTSSI